MSTSRTPFRILMVCTGNICRSTMAHQVLEQKVRELAREGDDLAIEVDSCGVSNEEEGNPIDRRAARVLRENGYDVAPHHARQILPHELGDWDLILAMTSAHLSHLNHLAKLFGVENTSERKPGDPRSVDIRLLREFDPESGPRNMDVPDPWYGDYSDFTKTLRIIERSVPAIVDYARRAGA